METGGICELACVAAEQCGANNPISSYACTETMHCVACRVAACAHCGDSSRSCAVCQDGFDLIYGECLGRSRWYWRMLYLIIGLAGVTVVLYVITTLLRPVKSKEILTHAKHFRELSKTREPTTGRLYPLRTNLRSTYISGVGIMLHFNFQYMVIMYAIFVFAVLWLLSLYFVERPEVAKQGLDNELSFDACEGHLAAMVSDVGHMENVYFWAVVFIYIASTVASIAFAVHQRRFANKTSEEMTTMQDYALTVRGLPKRPGTEDVEEDLKVVFERALQGTGVDVVGVSVCWDYRRCAEELHAQVNWELDQREHEWELTTGGRRNIRKLTAERRRSISPAGTPPGTPRVGTGTPRGRTPRLTPRLEESVGKSSSLGSPMEARSSARDSVEPPPLPQSLRWLEKADVLFLGIGEDSDDDQARPDDRGAPEVRAMLQNMRTSNRAYVVFGTERQRDRALEHLREEGLELQGHRLSFEVQDVEPDTVIWANAGTKDKEVLFNMTVGIILLLIGVALLDVFFYFPSIAYFLSMADVTGMTQGGLQGTLLGLLVCVCNQIIYVMIGRVADACRFSSTDIHEKFYVVGYTTAVFINTIIDLFVVMLLAQGYSMDQAIHMQTGGDSSMSTRAISESPSLQRAIYDQYWAYIFPSCLLIPFLAEPVAAQGLYRIKAGVVGSHPEVEVLEAELQLQCPPFDLARYGDILINGMLCLGLLAFTYRDLHYLFGCLILSLGWIYLLDTYRFLRASTRSSFVSSNLDRTAHWLCAVPCAILAGCIAFRLCGSSGHHDITQDLPSHAQRALEVTSDSFHRDRIVIMIFFAVFMHIALHCAVLKYLVPGWSEVHAEHDTEVPYGEKAAQLPCNWFNANPVHCLRSQYLYQHSPPCIKFAPGKEYLLKANADLGLHYETPLLPSADEQLTFRAVWNEFSKDFKEGSESLSGLRSESLDGLRRALSRGAAA